MRWLRNISLRAKLVLVAMLTSLGALVLAAGGFALHDLTTFRSHLLSRLAFAAEIVAQSSTAALEFNDPKPVQEILAVLKADPHLMAAVVYDGRGAPFVSFVRADQTKMFRPPAPQADQKVFAGQTASVFRRVRMGGNTLGTVYLVSDTREMNARLQRDAGIAALVLLASVVAALLLCSKLQALISKPVVALSETARRVAEFRNYALRAPKSGEDEVGQLVDRFNEMLAEIQARDAALQQAQEDLERRVFERTRELQVEVGERRRAEDALRESQQLYSSLVEHLPICVFRKDAEGRFTFANSMFYQLTGQAPESLLGRTELDFLPEDVAHKRVDDDAKVMGTGATLELEETFHNARGETVHLHSFKVPVYGSDGTVKGTQGCCIDITDRKRMEQALAHERELLSTLMDHSPDHIYFKDTQSRFVKCSRALVLRLGMKHPNEAIGKGDADMFHADHAQAAFEDEQRIIRTGVPLIGKVEREVWLDGHVCWVLTTKMPYRDKSGKIIGTFGISKDITELKRAEAELEEVHRKLMETSRSAGMAEVATGVLHNVGNVLNSVNVSATVIADLVRKSRISGVAKVAGLLHEHAHDLGTFFRQDSRGPQIADYLAKLSEHLVQEQTTLLREIGLLSKHIEHIKEVVVMQQTYAKVSGVIEPLAAETLVEDALRMNSASLVRHDVHVVRDLAPAPRVLVDRHKVLQILINLISNAKHALDAAKTPHKQIRIRVQPQDNQVRICVEDNGVGIATENLTRIFQHGFTTRQSGHGFGLHSSALAARELGGSLRAYSDGPGRGARFVLKLPAEIPAAKPEALVCKT